jgi:proline iminopeptidase
MKAESGSGQPVAHERSIAINGVDLFVREIGDGHPIIVLHGGPDFDHTYLRPELHQLADSCRLIYYDQRGRGRSAAGVRCACRISYS